MRNETLKLLLAGVSLILTMMLVNPNSFSQTARVKVHRTKNAIIASSKLAENRR